MMIKVTILLLFSVICIQAEKLRFDNYTLFKVYPHSEEQRQALRYLESNKNYDFWTDVVPSAEFVNVMVAPETKEEFQTILNTNHIDAEITIPDIQRAVEKQAVKSYTRSHLRSMTWDAYYTLDDINAWLDDIVATYPDIVTKLIGGETYEGRDIIGIKISHGEGKRAIFIEGGIHAREWISPSTVNYMIDQLLTSTNEETVAAARDFDWYLFPVTNPDGYIWTHESNRMWRKNRRPNDEGTYGVDLNRNWASNWMVTGASNISSTETYAGAYAFSEPETRTFATFIESVGEQIDLYISFHSYSQLLLLPFGNTTEPLSNYYDAMNIGRRAMGALSVRYGTTYVTGNIAEAIYEAAGTSIDWVKESLNVPLVYCYELRDRGTSGFLLPVEEILPNNQEVMDSVIDLIYQAKRYGYMSSASGITASVCLMLVSLLFCFV